MRRFSFLFIGLYLYCGTAFSQNADSVAFVTAKWATKKIANKTRLVQHHFSNKDLFASNQNITYIELSSSRRGPVLAFGDEQQLLKPTSTFGQSAGALAAINGTFFDVKNGGSVDYVKIAGQVLHQNRPEGNGQRAKHQEAAVLIHQGKLSLGKWNGTADWESQLQAEDVMVSGPLLVLDQHTELLDSGAFNTTRHPRTAIGLKPDGKVILLTVDGRNAQSAGMSLFELRRIMNWLGCTSSINLDGGGSTTLWVSGYPDNGVVNYPTDNKLWDHAGERKVANVVLLKTKNSRKSGTHKND